MPRQSPPPADIALDVALVRQLLHEQHPDLAPLSLTPVGEGWDNALFRLGDEWLVRLPRRADAAALIEHEMRWLPALAARVPLPIPAPVRTGRPGGRYPWSWVITPWIPGGPATESLDALSGEAPAALAAFLAALHHPAPADAPANPFRQSLRDRVERLAIHLDAIADDPAVVRSAIEAVFDAALTAPAWSGPAVWLHGDLHPGNLLVANGRPVAVIDFGDLTAGDPAVDLACAWMLWSSRDRRAFVRAYEDASGTGGTALWQRARGWTIALAVAYLAHSAGAPDMALIGHRTLRHASEDP